MLVGLAPLRREGRMRLSLRYSQALLERVQVDSFMECLAKHSLALQGEMKRQNRDCQPLNGESLFFRGKYLNSACIKAKEVDLFNRP